MEYLKHYILLGFLGIIRHWLEGGCQDEPEMPAALMITLGVNGTKGLHTKQ
jgi:hypothetical protein